MAQLRLILQEPQQQDESRTVNILGHFLRLKMDGPDRRVRRRRSLKERLGLKGMGCCGATWGSTAMEEQEHEHEQDQDQEEERGAMSIVDLGEGGSGPSDEPECLVLVPTGSGMNLAAALAAERHFRSAAEEGSGEAAAQGTPLRMSLMRLLEETTDGGDLAADERLGSDLLCCVCMGRKKGAAFIPCGHTFCRVCSREVWLNRGTCPICNRLILEILDIF